MKPIPGEQIWFANHSPNLFDRALAASRRDDGVATAILAVASVEALLTDLANCLQYLEDHSTTCLNKPRADTLSGALNRPAGICASPWGHELINCERALLADLTRYDEDHTSLLDKLEGILVLLSNGAAEQSACVPADFKFLVSVRNELVHPKCERVIRRTKNGLGSGPITGHRLVVDRLMGRKLIKRPEVGDSWLNFLVRPFADWCLVSTSTTVATILAALPETPLMNHFKRVADLKWTQADIKP
ncbi:hypothetical protein [Paraburkholderia tropica]|uniref:hypothetical protein n=1 Tax=Paraburkholderia tropica TaxID=92647 RepID=UPI00158FDDA9|nr:hypothetical protein [Paraburkholderia tropica]